MPFQGSRAKAPAKDSAKTVFLLRSPTCRGWPVSESDLCARKRRVGCRGTADGKEM